MTEIKESGAKRRWLISAAVAVLAMVIVLPLFRAPRISSFTTPAKKPVPPIRLIPGRPDELDLRDLAPLFLPTKYNARPTELHAREPGSSYFYRDEVHLVFADVNPALKIRSSVAVPKSPIETLADTPDPLALGIGRTNADIEPMPANGSHLDVYSGEGARSVLSVVLPVDAEPTSLAKSANLDWHPLELEAAVDATGLVGPLLITSSSGVEDVDSHYRNYLVRVFRIGDRLPPGFYRIVIGP